MPTKLHKLRILWNITCIKCYCVNCKDLLLTILPKLFFGGKSNVLIIALSFCRYLCKRWNSLYLLNSDHFWSSPPEIGTIWISYAKYFLFEFSLRCSETRGMLTEKCLKLWRLITKLWWTDLSRAFSLKFDDKI